MKRFTEFITEATKDEEDAKKNPLKGGPSYDTRPRIIRTHKMSQFGKIGRWVPGPYGRPPCKNCDSPSVIKLDHDKIPGHEGYTHYCPTCSTHRGPGPNPEKKPSGTPSWVKSTTSRSSGTTGKIVHEVAIEPFSAVKMDKATEK